MLWNWQRPDWPNFTWKVVRLAKAEERFLVGGGAVLGVTAQASATPKGSAQPLV